MRLSVTDESSLSRLSPNVVGWPIFLGVGDSGSFRFVLVATSPRTVSDSCLPRLRGWGVRHLGFVSPTAKAMGHPLKTDRMARCDRASRQSYGWWMVTIVVAVCGAWIQGAMGQENRFAGKNCLTSGCHAELSEPKFAHGGKLLNECEKCHEQTGREKHKYRMVAESPGLCFKCHDGVAKVLKDRVAYPYRHFPVDEGSCVDCHNPHASEHRNLLIERYVTDLYVPYDDGESFAMCFECHDSEMVEERETEETDFRNGDLNLHFLHVNKETKGRGCAVCHLTHGSAQPRLIRPTIPFRDWKVNVKYIPTEHGGYCGPACHSAKRYDRAVPVDWNVEPVAPASRGGRP